MLLCGVSGREQLAPPCNGEAGALTVDSSGLGNPYFGCIYRLLTSLLQHTILLKPLVLALCVLWLLRGYIYVNEGTYGGSQHQHGSSLSHLSGHCASLKPIPASEFHARQQALAENLHALGAIAYIAEPGPNALYFANLSLTQWSLSERPFFLVVTPLVQESQSDNETITPDVSIVTPRFESSRARLLKLPTSINVTFVEWEESEDPYKAVVSLLQKKYQAPEKRRIFMDEDTRYFLVDGIKHAARNFTVESPPARIRALRERKSQAELALLRCANEVRDLPLKSQTHRLSVTIGNINGTKGRTQKSSFRNQGIRS
jgi:hypothetical protein